MPPLPQVRAANKKYNPTTRPVVLILGGTSGIGAAMARKIGELTSGKIHLVILGRNATAADTIIASLPRASDSIYEFEKIDACSMKDVRRATNQLNARLEKINFIIGCSGYVDFKGVEITEEGLDKKAAAAFYGRMRLILDLLPLVESAATAGERVGVETILAAGQGTGSVDFTQLTWTWDMRGGIQRLRTRSGAFTDAGIAALSVRHPSIPFVHTYPGFVATNFGFSWISKLVKVFGFGSISPEVCAEHQWYPLLHDDSAFKSGAIHIDEHANVVQQFEGLTPEIIERIWEATVKAIDV